MAGDRDFRKLEASVQAELRRRAVALVDAGKTRQEAAAAVGVNRRFVGAWVKARDEGGEAALEGGKRGRRPGEQLALKDREAARIRRVITDKCPDQLKLPFALWTREAVAALIERETGIRLSLQAVSVYLKRWGFTAQRPMKRAIERREPEIRQWLESDYPALVKRAKAEKAEIQWADETGLSNQANYGRSFAPRGKTPVIPRLAQRFSQSMISSLTNRGKLRFMVYDGALNAGIFLRFLKRLVRDGKQKIFVIVDNLRPHRARIVTAWVAANTDKIELVYLPSYAPEHNPDEFVNNDVKQAMARRRVPRDKTELKKGLTSYMRSLQKRPAKVRAFFQAPTVRYAA
jgi:transposase